MATSAATYYAGDPDTARRLYRQALARDQTYKDARFGLAVIDLQKARGDKVDLERVEARLTGLIEALDPESDQLWYRAQYWRVVAGIYQGASERAPAQAEALFDPTTTEWWDPPKGLKDFLEGNMPNALVVLAAALKLGNVAASPTLADRVRPELGLGAGDVTADAITTALADDQERRGPAAYNLAGYYALYQEEDWINRSLELLEVALERAGPDLARTAWDDYTLQNLRDDAAAKPRFQDLLKEHGFDPAAP
jgi:hypothetical protein